jgi:3-oxoacyl-[acyl-carrier-protein] synthase III
VRIAGIAATLPSRIVSNEDVLDLIEHHSRRTFKGDLPRTLRTIGRLLERSGFASRHWLAEGEHPIELMKATFDRALKQAEMEKDQIDLLIYTGVARGFVEPANSCFVAKSLGLTCRNFDVLDACMGWVSSMDIVNDKMKAGAVKKAAIVNMEFNLVEGGHIYPKNFVLNDPEELAYKFPSFTVGEATTVTLLSHEDPDNFDFAFLSRPDLSDLCTVSLPGWSSFCEPTANMASTGGSYQFNSHGATLHHEGGVEAINIFNQEHLGERDFDLVFTHTSSPEHWSRYGDAVGITGKACPISHETGNIATASIPTGMANAQKRGALQRNSTCLGWQGSAGMTLSTMAFQF